MAIDRFFEVPDGLKLHYVEYESSEPDLVPVLCLPGLTRNHRDFSELAEHLRETTGRRILVADLRGRGKSEYDPDPSRYQPKTYVGDIIALLEDAGVSRVAIVGTSLGGILAMLLAAFRPEIVAGVVINDIGPTIEVAGMERTQRVAQAPRAVENWEEAAQMTRERNGIAYPGLDDESWVAFAKRTCVEGPDGSIRLDYDPKLVQPTVESGDEAPAPDLWRFWAALSEIPTLAIRGETSDLLSPETLEAMARDKPELAQLTVAGVGHTPFLTAPECLVAIAALLDEVSAT